MAVTVKRGHKKQISEVDKIFSEIIERWHGIAFDIYNGIHSLHEITDNFDVNDGITDGKDDYLEAVNNLDSLRHVLSLSLQTLHRHAETLSESIGSATIIKPIDDLETKVIAALRTVRGIKHSVSCSELNKALTPLWELACAKDANFNLPDWIRRYVRFDEIKEIAKNIPEKGGNGHEGK